MSNKYILASEEEADRLRLQARLWEPDAERLLDLIKVKAGWNCLDMGCGAMGILKPLSNRVGPNGSVVGVEKEKKLYDAACQYVQQENLHNVQLLLKDAFRSGLPYDSFDLVHERFVLPYVTPEFFLEEMYDLTAPGGIMVTQEPDNTSWNFYPLNSKWKQLKELLIKALSRSGDIDIGQKTYQLMKNVGMEQVKVHAAVQALPSKHPFMRMALIAAEALRPLILQNNWVTAEQLDNLLHQVEKLASDSNTIQITYTVIQVWGIKPQNVLH